MNELIREFAIQARVYADQLLGSGLPDTVWQDRYHQKFAELVVQECASLFPAEYDTVEGKLTVGKIIKNHFGVE